jgi:hypothetical protein
MLTLLKIQENILLKHAYTTKSGGQVKMSTIAINFHQDLVASTHSNLSQGETRGLFYRPNHSGEIRVSKQEGKVCVCVEWKFMTSAMPTVCDIVSMTIFKNYGRRFIRNEATTYTSRQKIIVNKTH